jgi:putative Mg2+ transporter-C (MgtC) family protein
MPLSLSFTDVCLRILLTALAGAALGFDRSLRGHPAGVKTMMRVAFAACSSMLQANGSIDTVGKTSDSFVVLDLIRFPLGVLTGVGLIGGGQTNEEISA